MTDIAAEFDAGWSDAPDELNAEVASLLATESAESRSADFTEVEPRTEEVPDDYPLPLFVCDDPHHRGHLTEKAASLTNFVGEAYVEMSPELAAEHGISEGDSVRVESPRGKVIAPAKISEWLDTPVVLLPRNFASTPVMSLIDRKVRVDRVRISKVEP